MKGIELYYHIKFKISLEILFKIKHLNIENSTITNNINHLNDLKNKFMILLGNLYINNNSKNANLKFERLINVNDFSNAINEMINNTIIILQNNNIIIRGDDNKKITTKKKQKNNEIVNDLQYLYNIYPKNSDGFNNINYCLESKYEVCKNCNRSMIVDSANSELRCNICGAIKELIGTSFDDVNICMQDGQKTKTGTFNPNRHFQFWWTHILADEPEEELGDKDDKENLYGEKTISDLKNIIKRDKKILRLLTIYDIRIMLREIGRTDLNKNIPLIIEKLTGIGPPKINDEIAIKVENLFSKSIEICENVRRTNRTNRNYYPYYIYKILDCILDFDDYTNRKIFFYIYIQSKETVEADDNDWEQICKILGEIQYKPTDRNMYLQYKNYN